MKKLIFALIAALTAAFSALTLCGCNIIDSNLPAIFSANDIYGGGENSGGSGGSSDGGSSSSGKMTEQQWNTAINNTINSPYCQIQMNEEDNNFYNGNSGTFTTKIDSELDLNNEIKHVSGKMIFNVDVDPVTNYVIETDTYNYFIKEGDKYLFNRYVKLKYVYDTDITASELPYQTLNYVENIAVLTEKNKAIAKYCLNDFDESIMPADISDKITIIENSDSDLDFLNFNSNQFSDMSNYYNDFEYDSNNDAYILKNKDILKNIESNITSGNEIDSFEVNLGAKFKDNLLAQISFDYHIISGPQDETMNVVYDFSYEQKPVEIPEEIRQKMV